ncbi:MAG: EamA family transporter [Pseudomonadota bacterium]
MMPHLTLAMLLLIGACVLCEAGRELAFKRASDGVDFVTAVKRPLIWFGIGLWLVELVAWIVVLETVPLSIAYPLAALNYVVIVIGGVVLLKEKITRNHMLGALLITLGVACVGVTGL